MEKETESAVIATVILGRLLGQKNPHVRRLM